jgi:hypothetical protein
MQDFAMVLAMFVRDGLEDMHHRGDLPQAIMPDLNTRIRDALYTALYVMEHTGDDWRCDRLVEMKTRGIPPYWEAPKLWEGVTNPSEIDEETARHFARLHAEKYGLPAEKDE